MYNGHKIVDYFPFFGPTGKELLELRINMLKDYVDEFVISESNRTHSGSPIKYELKETIEKLGLPIEKIKIIELDIPDNEDLVIEKIDHLNCSFDYKESDNQTNLKSLRARVIERMQKDALLKVLNDYDDKTIFIHSDSDEIIRPNSIEFIVNTVIANPNVLIKIPLVLLDGRADLRRYVKSTDKPTPWNGGMFVCIKDHLKNNTPTELRSCNNSKYQVTYITHNNETIEDMGWHFSWMGNNDLRQIKRKAMSHHDDFFPTTIFNAKYSSDEANDFFDNYIISEGNISSSGEKDSVLKKYPLENLPKEVFTLSRVLPFLLPGLDKSEILKSVYLNRCSVHGEINEHLSTLSELASSCKHVTEMGVNTGNSTLAFLNSDVILRSYDLYINDNVSRFFDIAKQENKDVKYIQGDTRIINIEKTDLLFIDTLHTYDQLKIELNRHCNKVKKYIVFHDTQTFGTIGEDGGIGLLPAVLEFVIEHPEWAFKKHYINNNGLTILQRVRDYVAIDKSDLSKTLDKYVNNESDPNINFELGEEYEKEGHYAPALSFYLRAAEYSDSPSFQYNALLSVAKCINELGNRNHHLKGVYLRAISLLPDRPDAYLYLAKLYESTKEWIECYNIAKIGVYFCNDESNKINKDSFKEVLSNSSYHIGLYKESNLLKNAN